MASLGDTAPGRVDQRGDDLALPDDRATLRADLYACPWGGPKGVGPARSSVLDCTFRRLAGDRLEVVTPAGAVVVSP